MHLYECEHYMQEVAAAANAPLSWEKLRGKSIAVSGATGMIGSFLTDVIMHRNLHNGQKTTVYAIGRSEEHLKIRFAPYASADEFCGVVWDVNFAADDAVWSAVTLDYMIHGASNTHPVAYAEDPVGTVMTNVVGTEHMLRLAEACGCERFAFLSSVEIYGENKGDTDTFSEDYLGYIDCNTMRAGYPESKRTGEALCQAYRRKKGISVVIPRLSRVYGPTMLMSDTKALSQFILKGVAGENIVLKSKGTQLYSYCYVADAATAVLKLLLDGADGEAYNVVSGRSDARLSELAAFIAEYTGVEVLYELPDETERAGYSTATKATLDASKLSALGWESAYGIVEGLQSTIDILRACALADIL